MLQTAEIEIGEGRWTSVTPEEALHLPRGIFIRCPKCGERVSVHRAGRDGHAEHFEHWPNTGGCGA